jgi:hypothetical protein
MATTTVNAAFDLNGNSALNVRDTQNLCSANQPGKSNWFKTPSRTDSPAMIFAGRFFITSPLS